MDKLPRVKSAHACWADLEGLREPGVLPWFNKTQGLPGGRYWSRVFEYPWVLSRLENVTKTRAPDGCWVLDAGGGDGPVAHLARDLGAVVVNVDLNPVPPQGARGLALKGDLRSLPFIYDGSFPAVVCISVLEHITGADKVVAELWRVLAPGGRFLATFDVASYARWNHTIAEPEAVGLLGLFGLPLPPESASAMRRGLPEIPPFNPGDQTEVKLRVMCLCADKER